MTKKVKDKIANDSAQGGSSVGYSFVKTYQTCPRRFALENILGVSTPGIRWALEQGSIVHGALENMYSGWTSSDTKDYITGMTEMLPMADEDREKMANDSRGLVFGWCEKFLQKDLEQYDDFEFEKSVKIPLLGGLEMTGRFDKMYTSKQTGALVIGDYKTTKRSISAMTKASALGDQFTLYSHAAKTMYPDRRVQTVIDIIWGRDLKSGFKVDCAREIPFVYTQDVIDRTVVGFTGVVLEIAQKIKSYLNGDLPLEFLFPRNGTVCGIFGCPFEEICRRKITKGLLSLGTYDVDPNKVDELMYFRDVEITLEDLDEIKQVK